MRDRIAVLNSILSAATSEGISHSLKLIHMAEARNLLRVLEAEVALVRKAVENLEAEEARPKG